MATLEGLQPEVRERAHAMLYEAGRALRLNSAFRTRAEQKRLYDGWKAGKPGFFPANKPGTSKHELGLAIDVDDLGNPALRARLAHKYGFYAPHAHEPHHLELRPGRPPFRPLREAKPLTVTTEIVGPMTRYTVEVPSLDGQGAGYVDLPISFSRVVSVLAQGPFPRENGYWDTPVFGAQARNRGTIVSITEGPPSGAVIFYVWVLNV